MEHYAEASFCDVTPCILPECSILKKASLCGPRYWSQTIDLIPEDKPWCCSGDNNDPFNSCVLYIKRKVGACSYVDYPIGRQSLLSRTMHKVFGSTKECDPGSRDHSGTCSFTVDQLDSTFSSDPILNAFVQLCCGSSRSADPMLISSHFVYKHYFSALAKTDRFSCRSIYGCTLQLSRLLTR